MKQVLILGASGFVGKNFLEQSKKLKNIKFTCISKSKGFGFESEQNIEWVKGDLFEESFLKQLFANKWDQVFNFFWSGLPARDSENNQKNFQQTIKIFEQVKKNNLFIITMGSGLEFSHSSQPHSDDSTHYSTDNFAMTKVNLHNYLRQENIRHKWIRPFYIFGKWQNPNSLLASIFRSNLQGNKFQPINDQVAHDFISIDDFADALSKFILNEHSSSVYNVGTGKLTSVREFISAAEAAIKFEKFLPTNEEFLTNGIYSMNHNLINEFNWTPRYIGPKGIYSYVLNNMEELKQCFRIQ